MDIYGCNEAILSTHPSSIHQSITNDVDLRPMQVQHAQDGARLGPRELLLVALRLGPCSRQGLLDVVGIEAVQSEGRWRVLLLLLVQGRRRRRNAAATGRLAATVAAREATEGLLGGRHGRRRGHGAPLFFVWVGEFCRW